MGLNLEKGQKLSLTKKNNIDLSKGLVFGLGFSGKNGKSIDLDSYVAVLDSEDKTIDFIYFANKYGQGIKHNGDDTTGGGRKNDPNETIKINLGKLNNQAKRLKVGLFIYSGVNHLGGVESAFSNLVGSNGQEICRFNVKDFGKNKSVEVAEVVKNSQGEWEYVALGKASKEGYNQIRYKYKKHESYTGYTTTDSTSDQSPRKGFFSRLLDSIFG